MFTVLIPARLGSSRLPDKPLADIAGLPMVVHVARRAAQSQAARVVVAADSAAIAAACMQHGVEVVLTRPDHPSGSDRLAEACERLNLAADDCVVNVQGDEPLIAPALIDAVAGLLRERTDCDMSTAAHPISEMAEFLNPNVVKVVLDAAGTALYFSRAPIPHGRDFQGRPWWPGEDPGLAAPLRHVGIYGYRVGFLRRFPGLAQAPQERLESLEQLRALWHGHRIAVHVSADAPGPGVDTPEDLARVRQLFAASVS